MGNSLARKSLKAEHSIRALMGLIEIEIIDMLQSRFIMIVLKLEKEIE